MMRIDCLSNQFKLYSKYLQCGHEFGLQNDNSTLDNLVCERLNSTTNDKDRMIILALQISLTILFDTITWKIRYEL